MSKGSRRFRRLLKRSATIAAIAVASGASVACAGSPAASSHGQVARDEQLALLPIHLRAGDGGWCLTPVTVTGCPNARLPAQLGPFRGPVIAELWTGTSGSDGSSVETRIALTTDDVAAVSLEGRPAVKTHSSPFMPRGFRGAIVDLHGHPKEQSAPALPFSRFIALNAAGQRLAQSYELGPPLTFEAPNRNWEPGAPQPKGPCSARVVGLKSLAFQGGSVMTAVTRHRDIRGREFVDCWHADYVLGKWPVEVDILLDAEHPGARPAALPAMSQLSGHSGVYAGPGTSRESIAARIRGAWLLVTNGAGIQQRLAVLEHARTTVSTGRHT
jgi:hypothetical protein